MRIDAHPPYYTHTRGRAYGEYAETPHQPASSRPTPDGMAERQALQADLEFHLAQVSAIAAALAGVGAAPLPIAHEAFVPLKTAAAAWGVGEDAARKRVKRLRVDAPAMVTKRNGGRWWVHREALV